jgi:protein ImuB
MRPAGIPLATTLSPAKSVATSLRAVARVPLPAATPAAELWAAVHLPGPGSAAQLEQLASCAQRLTPRVSLAPPDGLLLEVKGSLHLFAGVAGLRRELTAECRRLQPRPVVAFAPTPCAALTAARAGRPLVITDPGRLTGQLAPLPLSALRWPEETLARLARLGVRTIGAVLRLPRAGFARRFGAAQLAMLDELTGRTPDVRVAFRPRECFRRRRDLGCELEDHGLLLAALAPLFTALGAFLTARQSGVTQLECLLMHRQRQVTRCLLSLAQPCADGQRLAALFGERLHTLRLPEAVRACELRAEDRVPQLPRSHCLWQPGEHGGTAEAATGGLIERLRARLGPDAVQGLALREGHRPEKAWAITAPPSFGCATAAGHATAPGHASAPQCAAPSGGAAGITALPVRRPLWILPTPQPLPVQHGLPRRCGPLRLVSEAERIETGWWDGEEIARDYYRAVDVHGVRLWVFRERAAPHGWFLHGVFG